MSPNSSKETQYNHELFCGVWNRELPWSYEGSQSKKTTQYDENGSVKRLKETVLLIFILSINLVIALFLDLWNKNFSF